MANAHSVVFCVLFHVLIIADDSTDFKGTLADNAITPQKIDFTQFSGSTTQWRNWTPTLSNFTGTVNIARYTLVGKTCYFYIKITQGASVTGAHTFSLPVTATTSLGGSSDYGLSPKVAYGHILDAGTQAYVAVGTLYSTTTVRLMCEVASATYLSLAETSATIPMTWANGSDLFYLFGSYETA